MVVQSSGIRCIHVVSLPDHSILCLFPTSTCSISHLAALSSGDCRENAFDPSTNPGITQREPVRASPIVTSYYEYMSIRVLLTSTCTCIRLDGTVKYEQGKPLIHAQTIFFYILSIAPRRFPRLTTFSRSCTSFPNPAYTETNSHPNPQTTDGDLDDDLSRRGSLDTRFEHVVRSGRDRDYGDVDRTEDDRTSINNSDIYDIHHNGNDNNSKHSNAIFGTNSHNTKALAEPDATISPDLTRLRGDLFSR
jgi:hypothetical protein